MGFWDDLQDAGQQAASDIAGSVADHAKNAAGNVLDSVFGSNNAQAAQPASSPGQAVQQYASSVKGFGLSHPMIIAGAALAVGYLLFRGRR